MVGQTYSQNTDKSYKQTKGKTKRKTVSQTNQITDKCSLIEPYENEGVINYRWLMKYH